MFAWLKRLTEPERAILRRIERDHNELSDHLTLVSERLVRLDARLRKRSNRALAESDDGAADPGGAGDRPAPAGDLPLVGGPPAPEVSFTKEQLRGFARERGFLRH